MTGYSITRYIIHSRWPVGGLITRPRPRLGLFDLRRCSSWLMFLPVGGVLVGSVSLVVVLIFSPLWQEEGHVNRSWLYTAFSVVFILL